jgi:hypothetical protein
MKKQLFLALLCAATLTACEEPYAEEVVEPATASDGSAVGKTKKFTFTLKGDFTDDWKPVGTRGYMEADGKAMTDVWVLDYKDGALAQQRHLTQSDEDWAAPVLNLAYGSHHVYFIASRGSGATLNTDAHTISFTKVLDTFYKDYSVDVVATSNGNRAVTLDRVVTRLRLTFTDAISADAATVNFAPHTWYYAWDYIAGTPAGAATDQVVTINIPSENLGQTGIQANLFGFSGATEWTTDIAINSKTSGGSTIGSATITAAPFKANRISEYSGPLFGSEGTLALSLSTDWSDAYEGTW